MNGLDMAKAEAMKAYKARYYAENKARIAAKQRAYYENNKVAVLARNANWAKKNAGKLAEYQVTYAKVNAEALSDYRKERYEAKKPEIKAQHAAYQRANKEAVNARIRAWVKANPMKCRVQNGLRKRRVRLATPKWSDKDAVKDVYKEAHYMQMHVDHIIPLKHPLVCGLHVWDNLQLLSATENKAKGNKFAVEE